MDDFKDKCFFASHNISWVGDRYECLECRLRFVDEVQLAAKQTEARWNGAIEATEAYLIELKKKRDGELKGKEK